MATSYKKYSLSKIENGISKRKPTRIPSSIPASRNNRVKFLLLKIYYIAFPLLIYLTISSILFAFHFYFRFAGHLNLFKYYL